MGAKKNRKLKRKKCLKEFSDNFGSRIAKAVVSSLSRGWNLFSNFCETEDLSHVSNLLRILYDINNFCEGQNKDNLIRTYTCCQSLLNLESKEGFPRQSGNYEYCFHHRNSIPEQCSINSFQESTSSSEKIENINFDDSKNEKFHVEFGNGREVMQHFESKPCTKDSSSTEYFPNSHFVDKHNSQSILYNVNKQNFSREKNKNNCIHTYYSSFPGLFNFEPNEEFPRQHRNYKYCFHRENSIPEQCNINSFQESSSSSQNFKNMNVDDSKNEELNIEFRNDNKSTKDLECETHAVDFSNIKHSSQNFKNMNVDDSKNEELNIEFRNDSKSTKDFECETHAVDFSNTKLFNFEPNEELPRQHGNYKYSFHRKNSIPEQYSINSFQESSSSSQNFKNMNVEDSKNEELNIEFRNDSKSTKNFECETHAVDFSNTKLFNFEPNEELPQQYGNYKYSFHRKNSIPEQCSINSFQGSSSSSQNFKNMNVDDSKNEELNIEFRNDSKSTKDFECETHAVEFSNIKHSSNSHFLDEYNSLKCAPNKLMSNTTVLSNTENSFYSYHSVKSKDVGEDIKKIQDSTSAEVAFTDNPASENKSSDIRQIDAKESSVNQLDSFLGRQTEIYFPNLKRKISPSGDQSFSEKLFSSKNEQSQNFSYPINIVTVNQEENKPIDTTNSGTKGISKIRDLSLKSGHEKQRTISNACKILQNILQRIGKYRPLKMKDEKKRKAEGAEMDLERANFFKRRKIE